MSPNARQAGGMCGGVSPLTNFTFWGRLPTIQAALREQNER
jgi:hypothetical protein